MNKNFWKFIQTSDTKDTKLYHYYRRNDTIYRIKHDVRKDPKRAYDPTACEECHYITDEDWA